MHKVTNQSTREAALTFPDLMVEEVAAVLGLLNETASTNIDCRLSPLQTGVLIRSLQDGEKERLEAAGFLVTVAGDLATVHYTELARAAKRKRKKGKAAAAPTEEVPKRKLNQIVHLRDKQSLNLVRRLFHNQVGQTEDMQNFTSFYHDLDNLVGEYRIHCGIDKKQAAELDDDTDPADDVREGEVVASVQNDSTADLAALAADIEDIAANGPDTLFEIEQATVPDDHKTIDVTMTIATEETVEAHTEAPSSTGGDEVAT